MKTYLTGRWGRALVNFLLSHTDSADDSRTFEEKEASRDGIVLMVLAIDYGWRFIRYCLFLVSACITGFASIAAAASAIAIASNMNAPEGGVHYNAGMCLAICLALLPFGVGFWTETFSLVRRCLNGEIQFV